MPAPRIPEWEVSTMPKIITELPGPNARAYLEKSKKYEPQSMSDQVPLVWDRAEGCVIRHEILGRLGEQNVKRHGARALAAAEVNDRRIHLARPGPA